MLDANFNRALEGCRVIEDALRLGGRQMSPMDSRFFRVKTFRHRLSFLRSRFGIRRMLAARDVMRDAGAFRRDALEKRHASYYSLLVANLQRIKESLRVIEEVSRAVPAAANLSDTAKRLRFQAYTLEENVLSGRKNR